MKTSVIALAASAILAGAEARSLFGRNAHSHAHIEKRNYYGVPAPEQQTCKVVTLTTWVECTPTAKPTYETTEYVKSTVYVKPTTTPCSYSTVPYSHSVPLPTPDVTTCPTSGTYTFPAKTLTVTSTEYACVPTTTVLCPGTHTYGYHTTYLSKETTVTCPYATTYTSSSAIYTSVTSTVISCPTPGTYTIGGYTTSVSKTTTCSYPVVTSYAPATYTAPAKTAYLTETVYTCPGYAPYSKPTTTPAAKPYTPTPKPYSAPKPSTYAPKPKPTHPITSSSYSGDVGHGKQWCITYTQYNNDKSCKAPQQIEADIADLSSKGFKSIRVYAPDCDALPAISSACENHGVKIVLGIFFHPEDRAAGWSNFYGQVATITKWGKWDQVEFIVVGNESVFSGCLTASELAGFIGDVRGKLAAAGYHGVITTSEVVGTLQANPGLCSCIDVVAVNVQPYFNGGYSKDAGTFVQSQKQLAYNVCSKKTYVLEAGWPSAGSQFNNAVPSPEDQYAAVKSIYENDEGYITYYSTYDDYWKDASSNGGVEQHFGCSHLFPAITY